MRWLPFVVLTLCITGCSNRSSESHTTATDLDPAPTASARESKAAAEEPRGAQPPPIEMLAGEAQAAHAPRYSPPGKPLALRPADVSVELGRDALATELQIGYPRDAHPATGVLLVRSESGKPYDKLYVDANGDGQFNEEPLIGQIAQAKSSIFSSFRTTLQAAYDLEAGPIVEPYPVEFWVAVPSADQQPDTLRYSRRGYKTGTAQIGEANVRIVLSDANNDAVIDDNDWWHLQIEPSNAAAMRTVRDFLWVGDEAYRLTVLNPTGSQVQLVRFDPGITRSEDDARRDPMAADRNAPKAERPLQFRHDYEEALAEAKTKNLRCFIKFETTWCGPCKLMAQNVFTARDVVAAAEGIVCIKVDGDERQDLVQKFEVKGYPCGILLSDSGEELRRFLGYQNVPNMTNFLAPR